MDIQRCTFSKPLALMTLLFSMLGAACSVSAQTRVEDAWIRASVPGQQSTGAFMKVTASTNSKLVEVRSQVAKTVQIHRSTMQNDVMRMEPVKDVPLPAGKTVIFDPDSYHVMFIDLVAQVKEGARVPLTLIVESADGKKESIQINADVRPLDAPSTSR